MRLLEAIAGQVGAIVGRAELFSHAERLASEDPLTALANRRALEERLEAAFEEARACGSDLSLVLCDVDELKSLNDRLGHAHGDQVLRAVADALNAAAGAHPRALVARSGGDEFCILLPDEDASGAERYAREATRLARLAIPDLTLSFGVAWLEAGLERASELYRRADAAQYAAKRMGGGRICATHAETPLLPAPPAGRERRRSRRDATIPAGDLVSATVAALDSLPEKASALDRLELVAVALLRAIEAAAWSVSLAAAGEAALSTLRGMESNRDATSGLRTIELTNDDPYALEDYPATAQALAASSGFHVAVDDPKADEAERRLLVELGYRSVLAAATSDAEGRWLVELFGDERTPPMNEHLSVLRALVSHALASPPPARR